MKPETLKHLADIARAVGGESFSVCGPRDEEEMAREGEAFAAACIICSSCDQPILAVEVAGPDYLCTECGARICVLCGCTEESACEEGCHWIAPGICSTHEKFLWDEFTSIFTGGV